MNPVFTPADAQFLRHWIAERSGTTIREDQQYLIDSRLGPLAERAGLTPSGFADALRSGRQPLCVEAIDAAMNNETSWFRDPATFDALKEVILPELIAANARRRQLSVWSAAASGGQELYSVAMLLAEQFPDVWSSWDLRLVGTDISAQMVAKAAAGRYSQSEMSRGLPARYLVEHLHRDRLDWVVDNQIRRRAAFSRHNILDGPPPGRFDLVLCRYLLIYFGETAKARATDVLATAVAPTGVLILGGSELFVPQTPLFTTRAVGRSIVYQPSPAAAQPRQPGPKDPL